MSFPFRANKETWRQTACCCITPCLCIKTRKNRSRDNNNAPRPLINAGAKIGSNCIINSKALIEHDAIIGDHCHIATGAIVNGGVKVGSGTFFGSNAVSKEYIEIGENTVIAFGTKIIKNVP